MNEIGFFNETSYEVDEKYIKDLISFALNKENVKNAELNIIIVDNNAIKKINFEYRGKDYATDVVSFALEDEPFVKIDIRVLGDIYISYEKAVEQANEYKHSLVREISFLTIHGVLHLLGYDHLTLSDEKIMFERQETILNEYGIKR